MHTPLLNVICVVLCLCCTHCRVLAQLVCGSAPAALQLPSLLAAAPSWQQAPGAAAATAGDQLAGSASSAATHAAHAVPAVRRAAHVLACYEVLRGCAAQCTEVMARCAGSLGHGLSAAAGTAAAAELHAAVQGASERVVALVAAQGWDAGALSRLPAGVALPLAEAFQRCRASPPHGREPVVAEGVG